MKRNKKTQETNKMVLPDYTCGPSIQDFSMEWRTVELAVRDILKMQPVSRKNWMLSIEVIFYKLVVSPNYEFLQLAYDRIQIIFEAHVKECAQRIERSPAGNLLNDYYDIWNNFDDACKKLQALFFSLNSELRSIKYEDADLNDGSFMEIQNLGKKYFSLLIESHDKNVERPLVTSQR
ncbi:Hypothetical predicted protein [Cloeon dipterum]|uniref:Cullin N-terminal domain-containing protein n=1 Tax=Cloeon dipterum TaxID=197152 RepID=A0A8S1E2U7_9INSE|nr:Hypothetical predicted protein [Cloeon dipterum]